MTKKQIEIRPRGKQVLVIPEPEESRISEHGLVIPARVEQERKTIGEVVAVSPEVQDIHGGDIVIFPTFAGEPLKLRENGEEIEYKLLNEEDILGFLIKE